MSISAKVSGTWQELATIWAKVSGTWEQVQSAWVKVSGTWEQVYVAFTASVDDATPSGSASGASPTGFVTSDVATVTPSGGTAPYTYAWAQGPGAQDPVDGPMNAVAATSAATAFNDTVTAPNAQEEWTCTVTDDDSNETTVTVTVTLTWTDTT